MPTFGLILGHHCDHQHQAIHQGSLGHHHRCTMLICPPLQEQTYFRNWQYFWRHFLQSEVPRDFMACSNYVTCKKPKPRRTSSDCTVWSDWFPRQTAPMYQHFKGRHDVDPHLWMEKNKCILKTKTDIPKRTYLVRWVAVNTVPWHS